jgi:hypothetical protein
MIDVKLHVQFVRSLEVGGRCTSIVPDGVLYKEIERERVEYEPVADTLARLEKTEERRPLFGRVVGRSVKRNKITHERKFP